MQINKKKYWAIGNWRCSDSAIIDENIKILS